jgi:hypothetical protein
MNKKKIVLFSLIIVAGLLFINQMVYPMWEGGCYCFGEDSEHFICQSNCYGTMCGLNWGYQGICDDYGFCVYQVYYDCLDLNKSGIDYTWNYCWDCNEW